jgi:hypothetical protein
MRSPKRPGFFPLFYLFVLYSGLERSAGPGPRGKKKRRSVLPSSLPRQVGTLALDERDAKLDRRRMVRLDCDGTHMVVLIEDGKTVWYLGMPMIRTP